ncbi:MAG: glycosyltransferase family 2 protein, partial [Bacteroidaceae bacterium]|nr:glycosyltransferase family 2 protein [Bacteroidaceae bacterium]
MIKDKSIPAISIVMSAYNVEKYIKEAIDSIIGQSFSNFECIIVDDGSTDSTRDIIRSCQDERIVLLENKHDFIASLNLGMDAARGKYIARMDADDIMHPDRLKIQYSVMESEPSITVCGTWMQHFGERVPPQSIAVSVNG